MDKNSPVSTVEVQGAKESLDGSRLQSNKLQKRINRLPDGRLPASRSLAEISCLLKSHYRVNKILFTEIHAPKTASATVKARKRGGRMQTAAVLTSNVSQPSSETAQHEISEKEVTTALQTGGRSVSRRAFVDKENIAPTERDGGEGNLERSF